MGASLEGREHAAGRIGEADRFDIARRLANLHDTRDAPSAAVGLADSRGHCVDADEARIPDFRRSGLDTRARHRAHGRREVRERGQFFERRKVHRIDIEEMLNPPQRPLRMTPLQKQDLGAGFHQARGQDAIVPPVRPVSCTRRAMAGC